MTNIIFITFMILSLMVSIVLIKLSNSSFDFTIDEIKSYKISIIGTDATTFESQACGFGFPVSVFCLVLTDNKDR